MKKLTSQEQGTANVHRNHDSKYSYWKLATLSSETKDITSWDTGSTCYNWVFFFFNVNELILAHKNKGGAISYTFSENF